jgi:hypothetical protein
LHIATFFSPAVIGVVADPDPFTNNIYGIPLFEQHFSFTQLADDLFTCIDYFYHLFPEKAALYLGSSRNAILSSFLRYYRLYNFRGVGHKTLP